MTDDVPMYFDGRTYSHTRDGKRLGKQYLAVFRVMTDGMWHTLSGIQSKTGYPEASISARLRDMKKKRFGEWPIESKHVQGGLWWYRLNKERFPALDGPEQGSLFDGD